MDTLLLVLAILALLVGILGSVLPALPGPPLSWAALLTLYFTPYVEYDWNMLLITGLLAAVITILDYAIPSLTTKKFGGTKYGIWGCNIGLVISIFGLPFGPQGLLGVAFWPFAGALIGELLNKQTSEKAIKAALGSFVGFLSGTLIKLAYSIVIAVIALKEILA